MSGRLFPVLLALAVALVVLDVDPSVDVVEEEDTIGIST